VTAAFGKIGYSSINIFTIHIWEIVVFFQKKAELFLFLSVPYYEVIEAFTPASNAINA
jgi:hypothetical protein